MKRKKITYLALSIFCFACVTACLRYIVSDDSLKNSPAQVPSVEEVISMVYGATSDQSSTEPLRRERQVHFDRQLTDLQSLPNNKLINSIRKFWKSCKAQNSCEDQLKRIEAGVSSDRYIVIKEYPDNARRLNEALEYEVNTRDQPLTRKIETIRAVYESIWGAAAEQLFSEELGFYDQHVELNSLYLDNQYLELEDKMEVFSDWVQARQDSGDEGLTPYQSANIFFGDELAAQSDQVLAIRIAEKFLSGKHATKEKQRLYRRQAQTHEAQSYQEALLELRQVLEVDRKERYSNLSDDDWVTYQAKKIREFKIQFFSETKK